MEYHDNDIEEPTFIDEYGDQYDDKEDWWDCLSVWKRQEVSGIPYEDYDGDSERYLDATDCWWDGLSDETKTTLYEEYR